MSEFRWIQDNDQGCIICGSPSHPRGFVDMIGDVFVRRGEFEVSGVVDIVVCGGCLEQAARYVGCASKQEVEDFAYRENELFIELEKTKDEVKSHIQRHEQFLDNLYQVKPETLFVSENSGD